MLPDIGADCYRRYLEGDESGFEDILDLYKDHLIFFINRYVSNLSIAEELAEDAFLELLIHKNRYNFKTSFKTYLFTIGRNKAIDYARRGSRYKFIDIDEVVEKSESYIQVEEKLLVDERKRVVNEALGSLKENYRAVLHLVYYEELSYEEAAKVMKKNRKQIENLVYRARKALREVLEKGNYDL
ncbi:MAG TPA: RNA polymerase sigma factor [Clostridiaceae bacterium]|mgnify:FL=1|jgi:RNA polymerase sigma factor (sigma-70 family)|nr:RNA polymerase sigma factor [Clostridiaceae bacterium]